MAMDAVIQSKHLSAAVRRALKSASTLADTGGVRVVSMKGGFRLQSTDTFKSDASASAGQRRKGPGRIGVMEHLGLTLDD
jgi:hypothetical protein